MTCVSKMWLISNVQKIKVLALTIFIYLVSPLLLLCILTLLVYRGMIAISAKVSRKDLHGMISGCIGVLASDQLYGIPNYGTLCCLVVKGRLSLDSLQSSIDKKILSLKNAKGLYKYQELRMYPTKFRKFLFWKVEEEFKIDSHVVMYEKARDNNKIWSEQDLQEIQKNLIRKQWTRFTSPWEILLIPNYRTQNCGSREVKTVLCVRFHRCIGSEVSWLSLLAQVLCESGSEPDVSISPTYPTFTTSPGSIIPQSILEQSGNAVDILGNSKVIQVQDPIRRNSKFGFICGKILKKLLIPFRIPFDFAEQIMEPITSNEWQVAEKSLLKRDHVVTLDRFSVQHVQEIKNLLGVTFSSILMAALSSALRVTFMEAGLKLPSQMKVMLPISSQDETSEPNLKPSGSLCWINLPTGVSSSRERLRCCEASQKQLESSTRAITNHFLIRLIGILPFKYHWYFIRKRPWTGVLMNLKGSSEVLNVSDHQIEDVIISSASDSGFVLSFFTYANYLRISLVIDGMLIPTSEVATNFLKNIYAELVLLGIDASV